MSTRADTEQRERITRREAIVRVGALLGGAALIGGHRLAAALENAQAPAGETVGAFAATDIALFDEIAETILPATRTPGAKAAKTGAFIALMVSDCYSPAEQKVFRDGIRQINAATKKAHGVAFIDAQPSQRLAVLAVFDREQKQVTDAREAAKRRRMGLAPLSSDAHGDTDAPRREPQAQGANVAVQIAAAPSADDDEPAHFFRMLKELTLLGYFTSEIGCTQAQRFVEVPARYDPCVAYSAGEPAWADHA